MEKYIILSLNNGDIISSKRTSIFLYDKNNFEIIKETKIGFHAKQIIELYNKDIVILSPSSELFLIKANTQIINKIFNNKNLNIFSILEINNGTSSFISYNDSTRKNEINYFDTNSLKLEQHIIFYENDDFNSKINSFIVKNIIYISSLNYLYLIDINSKKINKYEFTFSKIYSFNDNIFGINEKSIYNITLNDGEINTNKVHEDNSDITCLFYSADKKYIFCTKNKVGSF